MGYAELQDIYCKNSFLLQVFFRRLDVCRDVLGLEAELDRPFQVRK